MWAVVRNHSAVVRLLHQRGANINAASSVFVPPPIRPDRVGQAAGAGITRQKSQSAPQGKMTPLLYAARAGNVEMLRLLLELKADIKLTDANGTSPLVFALVNGHVSTARFLLEISRRQRRGRIRQGRSFHRYRPAELRPAWTQRDN
jgi:ankyrin repeat protein